jgi:hypothetical protein
MNPQDTNSTLMTAAVGIWLVVLTAVPVLCASWLSQGGLIALISLEAVLSMALLMVKVRARKAQQEKRQVSAIRAAIDRGILY